MRMMFCWRCQMEMPMLDEEEFAQVSKLYVRRPFPQGILEAYKRITGMDETNPAAVMHHRIAEYGPPCRACGKPLRSPNATFCGACGEPRD